jgi:PAS domain S-box-containing protein
VPGLAAAIAGSDEGWVRVVSREGLPFYMAFSRSAVSGWTTTFSVAAKTVEAGVVGWSVGLTAGGLLLGLIGVGLALVIGRRIAGPIATLAGSAEALGRGEALRVPESTILEVAQVGRALEEAGHERRHVESALREREAHLRLVTDAAPALIAYVDTAQRYRFVNRRSEDWLGVPPAEVLGRTMREVTGQIYDQLRPHVEAALTGSEVTYELTVPKLDGGSRSVRGTYVPDVGEDGAVRGFVALVTDVTEHRALEAQLREEGEVLETINDIGQRLSAELDLEKLVQFLTDEATRLSGAEFGAFFYNVSAPEGGSYMLYTISGVPRDAFARFPMPRATALFGPTFRGEGVIRLADVKKDPRYGKAAPHYGMPPGHLPVTSYLAVPVVSRFGEVIGGLFFGHSRAGVFTERHERIIRGLAAQTAIAIDNARLYEKEQRAREAAEAANRTKDEFLATLSHELRTPLNAVLGWARLLRGGQLGPADSARAIQVIERNASAQAQLIEDLLDVSRIVSGKLRLDLRPVNLAGVIEAAIDAVRPAAHNKGVQLESMLDPSVGRVPGDAGRLQQVVWNLLSNAIKFTPREGRAEIRLTRADGHVDISVTDTGKGIAPDLLPYVFERFRQGDSSSTRAYGGLGIGLALVKHLVELHGGSVRADSPGEHQGATFTVSLPLARAS